MDENKKPETKPTEKMVTIRLPLTRTEKDDVYVSVNNRTWLIQRGKDVQVPECVAEVLQHQEEMLEQAMLYEEKVAQKAEK
jgi:hypothetical protein